MTEESRDVQKIRRIHSILQAYLAADPNRKSVFLPYSGFLDKEPLLHDRTGLKKVLAIIQEKSISNITWEEIDGPSQQFSSPAPFTGVAESMENRMIITTLKPQHLGVEVHVPDPAELDNDFRSIPKEVNDEYNSRHPQEEEKASKDVFKFSLDADAKLSLIGSDKDPYRMEKGRQRYKIVLYLAKKEGKPAKTQELVKSLEGVAKYEREYETTATNLRKTIGKIRTLVSKKFNVPSTALIQRDSEDGYSISTIEIESRSMPPKIN